MNRILIVLAVFFILNPVAQADHANRFGEGFDSIEAKIYINENCNSPPSAKCVLVISNDGHYVAWSGTSLNLVRKHALAICHSRSSEPNTCKVVDENMQSDFIQEYLGANFVENVAMESLCFAEYQKSIDKPRFLDNLGWGLNQFLDSMDCEPFFDESGQVWVGSKKKSTQSEYEECYSIVHSKNIRREMHVYKNWKALVENYLTQETDPTGASSIILECAPFLSADYLTWTAPSPEELNGQSVEESKVVTIPKAAKTIDPPEPRSPEAVSSQSSEADKNIELEFWQSIKDSNDADMYREYLRQFPIGVYAGLAKLKIKKLGGDLTTANASIPNLDYGDYYALVIGNNEYQDLPKLESAVNDAKVVSTVLEVDYGFNVKLLENASRKDILRALKNLRQTVSAKDNILIYYAGHGWLDEETDDGYWLPVDSERDDDSNWIATDRVISQVKGMKAKHVMVVADSCFSGTISRGLKILERTPEWFATIVKKKSRTALTSGGLEPVLDTVIENHSAFAYAFISLLEENDGVLDASQLFSQLRPKVMVNATQTPEYSNIHQAGHDGGDFLFVRR